jgi:pyrroline-5-carboxylate reductase
MGVAILSGVLSSLETRQAAFPNGSSKSNDEPPSGISTPTASQFLDAPDAALPSRFIATVGREETGRKLKKTFAGVAGGWGDKVEVRAGGGNVSAVQEADVVIVWCVKD